LNPGHRKLSYAQSYVQTYDMRTHKPPPGTRARLGAASYTKAKSQWSLWELQGAQHFSEAEHLYLDS